MFPEIKEIIKTNDLYDNTTSGKKRPEPLKRRKKTKNPKNSREEIIKSELEINENEETID